MEPKARITELDWQLDNAKAILKCSNATPIRCYVGARFACSYCMAQYTDPTKLRSHTETHRKNSKPDFLQIRSLSRFLVYLDVTNLTCKLCDTKINTIKNLLAHLSSVHEEVTHVGLKSQLIPFKFSDSGVFTCAMCDKCFEDFAELEGHMNEHFKNYVCEFCEEGFVNRSLMIEHKQVVHNVLQKIKYKRKQ